MALYFLALLPSEVVREEIKLFKLEMAEKFGARHALKLPAHITLISPFKLAETLEEDLIKSLKDFAQKESSYKLKLHNFGSFPPRVIYVEVENKEPVIFFQKRLQQHLISNWDTPESIDQFHPHLTIATRDLKREIFPKAWEYFRNKEYSAFFDVNNFSLMEHNGKYWELASNFRFAH